MAVQRGTGSGNISLTAYKIPCAIVSFNISNKTASNITVSVSVVDGKSSNQYLVSALDYVLKPGQAYIRDSKINLKPKDFVKIQSSGTIDYYFSIE